MLETETILEGYRMGHTPYTSSIYLGFASGVSFRMEKYKVDLWEIHLLHFRLKLKLILGVQNRRASPLKNLTKTICRSSHLVTLFVVTLFGFCD